MKKPITYLAGPMTGLPDFNHEAFMAAGEWLRGEGHIVHNPAMTFGGDKDQHASVYLRHCMHMLLEADRVVFLPGWKNSNGATMEAYVAQGLKLKMFELENNLLIPYTGWFPTIGKPDISDWIDEQADMQELNLYRMPEHRNAEIGMLSQYGRDTVVCYDQDRVMTNLEKEFGYEGARDWFDVNTFRGCQGEGAPYFLDTPQ